MPTTAHVFTFSIRSLTIIFAGGGQREAVVGRVYQPFLLDFGEHHRCASGVDAERASEVAAVRAGVDGDEGFHLLFGNVDPLRLLGDLGVFETQISSKQIEFAVGGDDEFRGDCLPVVGVANRDDGSRGPADVAVLFLEVTHAREVDRERVGDSEKFYRSGLDSKLSGLEPLVGDAPTDACRVFHRDGRAAQDGLEKEDLELPDVVVFGFDDGRVATIVRFVCDGDGILKEPFEVGRDVADRDVEDRT